MTARERLGLFGAYAVGNGALLAVWSGWAAALIVVAIAALIGVLS